MSATGQLLALVATGHELMTRERTLLLKGDFATAVRLASEKHELLASLEPAMARVRGTDAVRTALAGLIAEGRRNERILIAARQGLAQARRRIDAIVATLRGAVAYDRDGQTIASREDATQKSSRA